MPRTKDAADTQTIGSTSSGVEAEIGREAFERHGSIMSTLNFSRIASFVKDRRKSLISAGTASKSILSITSKESKSRSNRDPSGRPSRHEHPPYSPAYGAETYVQREEVKQIIIPDFVPIAGIMDASELPKQTDRTILVGIIVVVLVLCFIVVPFLLSITLFSLAVASG